MDANHFDAVARALAARPARRTVLGLTLGGVCGVARLATIEARKKRKRKKRKKHKAATCTPACQGDKRCQAGTCACPEGTEECGGNCLALCPANTQGAQVVRHPGTCDCCIRPYYLCDALGGATACCGEPESLPCCGAPCEPLAEYQECREIPESCHHDVECGAGRICAEGNDPRSCIDDPAG